MYGVTHVVTIDGHSIFIPAGSTMPIKYNKTIYGRIFRYIFLKLTNILSEGKAFDNQIRPTVILQNAFFQEKRGFQK